MVKRGRLTRWFSYHSILFQICSRGTNKQGAEERRSRERGPRKRKVVKRKRVQHGRRIVLRIHLRNLSGEDNEGLRKGDDVTRGFTMK